MSTTGGINSTSFTVGSDGKLNVGGIASGIDSKAIIDALMLAKRQPAVQIETKISVNASKISALGDFKTKVNAVTTALDKLRASPGSSTNVFDTKAISGTTSAVSGTASDVDSLLIATVSASAQNMSHTIKVNSLAQAHQVRSDAFTSTTTSLTSQGVTAGNMTVGGKTITISASDSLLDLRAKINNADAGVTATIVSSNSTSNYLVLTSTESGVANAMTFGGDVALTDTLGLTQTDGSSVTTIKNPLRAAQDANIDVDGITGITRSTNQIDDVLTGVTLSLLKSEPGTTITLKIEPDLSAIKTAMNDFVSAYNDVRAFVTDQRTASDRNDDGTIDDNEVGPLAYDQTVRDTLAKLGELASTSVTGATDGYASLGQVGIVMKSDYTLGLDDSVLDSKLLTNVEGFKELFALNTSVSDSRVTFLARGTSTASGTYSLVINGTDASGNVTGATWNGVAMTVDGRTLTAADGTKVFFNGGASLGTVSGISVEIARGVADLSYDFFNGMTKNASGTIDTQVQQFQTTNQDFTDRVKTIDSRLEVTRKLLEAKYTAMETAMAKLQTLQQTIQSFSDSLNNSSNS